MRDQAANETALKAIGSRRKRPSPNSSDTTVSSDGAASVGGPSQQTGVAVTSSLFAPLVSILYSTVCVCVCVLAWSIRSIL